MYFERAANKSIESDLFGLKSYQRALLAASSSTYFVAIITTTRRSRCNVFEVRRSWECFFWYRFKYIIATMKQLGLLLLYLNIRMM